MYAFLVRLFALTILFAGSACSGESHDNYLLPDPNVSAEISASINERKVIIGMCPLQAQAAAGKIGRYRVMADPDIWKNGGHPLKVIQAQCSNPDNSVITLDFKNSTQFNSLEDIAFKVKFEKGKVTLIEAY